MKKIIIVGLGSGDIDQLPLGVYKLLKASPHVYLRTKEHPVVGDLEAEGIHFPSFDEIYEQHEHFEAVYEEICHRLLEMARDHTIVYAVPGHPLVAERTVQLLLKRADKEGAAVEIKGGHSFIDSIFQALGADPIEGFQLLDATSFSARDYQPLNHAIIGQVYDSFVASNTKLTLMEKLPDDYEVYIVTAAGSREEKITKVLLYELDREIGLGNLTSVYVPPVADEKILYKDFAKLREVIGELRGPNGCPWDKKQTHESLKRYLLEESYELIEAINNKDIDNMVEELGDVLLQVMLHAQIGEDEGFFTISDVIEGLTEKMVRRHPHVFGDADVTDEADVLKKWQEIKNEEKTNDEKPSLLAGIGKGQPSLSMAHELQKEAAKVGFDWEEFEPIWEKVKEELEEFSEEIRKNGRSEEAAKEFGDVLFALVNAARYFCIHPEEALMRTNQKFAKRFSYVEQKVRESGTPFSGHTLEQLDAYWEKAKKKGH